MQEASSRSQEDLTSEIAVEVGDGAEQFSASSLHPLLQAASEGDLDAIDSLLDEGADVNYQNENGWTPAIFAVEYHRYEALLKV